MRKCGFTVLIVTFCLLSQVALAAEIHLIEGDLEVKLHPQSSFEIKLPQSPRSAAVVFRGVFELFDSVKLKNALRDAKERHPGETVYLYIDSPGGSYKEALKILDLMEEFRKHTPIVTVACGPGAFSAGAMIWLGGTECQIVGGSVVGFHAPYYPDSSTTTPELIKSVRERMMKDASRLPAFSEYAQDMADYVESLFAQQGPQGFLVAYIDWKKKRLELDMWKQDELAELPQRWLTGYDEAWDSFLTTSVSVPYARGYINRNTWKSIGIPIPSEHLKIKKLIKEDIPPISIYSVTFTEKDELPKFGKTEIDSHVFLDDDATSLRPLFAWHLRYGATYALSSAGGKKCIGSWTLTFLYESGQEDSQLKEGNSWTKKAIDDYKNAIVQCWQIYCATERGEWQLKLDEKSQLYTFTKSTSYPPLGMCMKRLPLTYISKFDMWDQ